MNDMSRTRIGGNNPPETLAQEFAIEFADDLREVDGLVTAAATVPDRIDDDDTQNKVAELIKKMRAIELKFEKARDTKREPHRQVIEQINGFFKVWSEKLEKPRKLIKARSDDYLQRKAEEEKRRLREEEEKRRIEAERKLKLAQDAESTRNQAKAAADEASRLATEAEEARKAAQSEQELSAAKLTAARAELAKAKAEMFAKNAEFARLASEGNPVADDIKAENRRRFEYLLHDCRQAVDTAEEELRQARARAIAAREEQQRKDEEARKAAQAERAAAREQNAALNAAVREERAADKLAAKAGGPEADLARTRSLHGAVSTLSRRWTCTVTDRDQLDRDKLWPHINMDAIEAAAWKWMMAQSPDNRRMAGAIMQEETEGQIR